MTQTVYNVMHTLTFTLEFIPCENIDPVSDILLTIQRSVFQIDSLKISTVILYLSITYKQCCNKLMTFHLQRVSGGYSLQKASSASSSIDDDADSAGSGHSAEEPSVFGLYKGLKKQDSFNSAQDMVMWSPEFSFGHESSSTMSSGFHSSSGSQGLRRMKVPANGKR